jgi:hypothetical protein
VLFPQLAEYLKTRSDDGRIHIVQQEWGGEDSTLAPADPKMRSAEIVEGSEMCVKAVGKPDGTRFTHFLDGIQESRLKYYDGLVPIVYGFTGAVVRSRDQNRRMSTCDCDFGAHLYFPFSHVDYQSMLDAGLPCHDVEREVKDKLDPVEAHPAKLKEAAQQAVSNNRRKREAGLADGWTKNAGESEWLLWDGSIAEGYDVYKHGRAVGVIKSHQTQYFMAEKQAIILSLKVGERSSVFRPTSERRTPVYSWYLRLHGNVGKDLYFGLIRVEAAARTESIVMADEISRWLLTERSPLALPDSRWDRMLYPIRDCEQYLRSIKPSKTMIDASLTRL